MNKKITTKVSPFSIICENFNKIQKRMQTKDTYTEDLKHRNRILQSKILTWYAKTKDKDFKEFFEIETVRKGKI
jgi:hypothetical protein